MLASVAVGGGIALRELRIDFAKLSPAAGLRRIASARTLSFAARSMLAACIATAALTPIVRDASPLGNAGATQEDVAAAAIRAVRNVLVTATLVGVAFGLVDTLLERLAWRRRLRMSFDEMKRDLKQSEGDPQLRSRRRAQHRALIRGSLLRLPEATFVVANPAHVAIALEYRPPEIAVPRVVLRAIDAGAQLVKSRARSLGIPIVEDVSLARTLLATTRIDDVIPRECYLAVARIVAVLLRGREEL